MRPITRRAFVAGTAALPFAAPTTIRAQGKRDLVRLALNFQADGGNAAFYYGLEKGYYRDLGIDIRIDPSSGSGEAITRVASGLHDFGIADIATLIEFASRQPDVAPVAVFILHDRSASAIISAVTEKILTPKDLVGKTLSAGLTDAPVRLLPAFLRLTGLSESDMQIKRVSPQLRDSMTLTKQANAIVGYDYTTFFNLKSKGMRIEDVHFLYFADYGLNVYGNSILASQAMLREKPDVVRRFVAASTRSWRETLADPKVAVDALTKHTSLVDKPIEIARIEFLAAHEIVTPRTRENGIGFCDTSQLADNLKAVAEGFALTIVPTAAHIWNGSFLPPIGDRLPLS